ncbi:MAG: lamin tail domain-containing protein, partial [Planctomycetota bacterium]
MNRASERALVGRVASLAFGILIFASTALEAITITEIMYHPRGADEAALGADRSLEWIEIYNETGQIHNLSGYRFTNGINFTFPPQTYLEARSYLVVCADEDAVRTHYGITNTIGDYTGSLDNNGERIELAIYGGGTEVRAQFGDRGEWPHETDGTGHSLVLTGVYRDPNEDENWARSAIIGGTPGGPNFDEPTIVRTEIIADDEVWSYRKGTSAYPAGWNDIGFNDAGWLRGRTGIGYSDGDDRTELNDMQNGYWSFAARYEIEFTQEDIDNIDDLLLELSYDDGFVFYVNGAEIARAGISGTPNHQTPATSHEAEGFEPFSIPKSRLRVGENVFACEIHNQALNSSDSSFVPRISSVRTITPTPAGEPVPVVINEVRFLRSGTDAGDGFVEFFNTSSTAVDLSGLAVSDDRNDLAKYTLPGGSTIPGRGFFVVTEADSGLDFSAVAGTVTFYLSRADGSEVIAAELLENSNPPDEAFNGFSEARIPDGSGRFYASSTPTSGAANVADLEDRIVINEVMYHLPREREGLEFVEIYNRSGETVDLTGMRFSRGISYDFPDGTMLDSGEYLVVAKNPEQLEAAHGIGGVLGPFEGELGRNDELIRIVDSYSNIVDQVHYYDSGRWPSLADAGGSSLELIDPMQDNSVASAWAASDESSKSEWEQFEYSAVWTSIGESELQIRMLDSGECLLDDFSVKRNGSETEYVRNGTFDTSLSSWRVGGNHDQSRQTDEDSVSGNGSLHIRATGDGDLRVNRIEQDAARSMTSGTFNVSVWLRWLRGGNLIHFSGYRQHPSFQKSIWMTYPENLGSPGQRNSMAVDNLGPVISEVVHSPTVPSPGLETKVVARVSAVALVASQVASRPASGTSSRSRNPCLTMATQPGRSVNRMWS